jgi:hypothetical protein
MRPPEPELVRHSSKAGTDDTSVTSSCDRIEDKGTGRPPRIMIGEKLKSLRRATSEKKSDSTLYDLTLKTESKDSLPSILSLHKPECPTFFERSKSVSFLDRNNKSPPPVKDILLHLTGVVPPSSMPKSATERQARILDKTCEKESSRVDPAQSLNSSAARDESLHSAARTESASRTESTSSPHQHREYAPGSIVEVKISDVYQPATIDSQPFKGVYNVTLFGDTPAWNEKRTHVDIYRQSPERMPEVLGRDLRPFAPAPVGEVIYVFVNGTERKCCVQGYSYEEGREEVDVGHMKYVVKFAKRDGGWRNEKHRVPVQRAYRRLCEA